MSNLRLCYECDTLVHWLAPDGRCQKCTRYTNEEVRGEDLFTEEDDDDE